MFELGTSIEYLAEKVPEFINASCYSNSIRTLINFPLNQKSSKDNKSQKRCTLLELTVWKCKKSPPETTQMVSARLLTVELGIFRELEWFIS